MLSVTVSFIIRCVAGVDTGSTSTSATAAMHTTDLDQQSTATQCVVATALKFAAVQWRSASTQVSGMYCVVTSVNLALYYFKIYRMVQKI